MRYLPALLMGIAFTYLVDVAFYYSAQHSPIMDFLITTRGLNANSVEYLLLGVHDTFIKLLLAFLMLVFYKKLLGKFPFDFISAIIMQLPVTLIIVIYTVQLSKYSPLTVPDSIYALVNTVGIIVSGLSVIFVFWLFVTYNKGIKNGHTAVS